MKKIFKVALVGCGSISGNHVAGILNAGQSLCALCDIDPTHAEGLIAKHGLQDVAVYTDYEKMLDREHPDCVHICTPHYLHLPMVRAALSRNIHVLCEKPLCISMDELRELKEVVSRATAQYGICFQNRYSETARRLRELAKDGVLGAFANVVWNRSAAYYASGAWRGSWEQEGGGVMINQAIHTLDLLQWVCGMPDTVTCHLENDHLKDCIEVEDTATAVFKMANGAALNFFATTGATADFPPQIRLRLSDKSYVTMEKNMILRGGEVLFSEVTDPSIGKAVWGSGHVRLIADFYDSIASDRPFAIGFDEAEAVMRLVFGMYTSNGLPIPVPTL